MRPEIPLEILGLLGPLLSWAEAAQADSLPKGWNAETSQLIDTFPGLHDPNEIAASYQERSWLLQELPTYSLDNVDDIVDFARREDASRRGHNRWQPPQHQVAPPPRFDLFRVFEKLAQRYLAWNGGEVTIRAGRMVELHELGLRIPLSFIVRHAHARAVAAGEQALSDVVNLPESISLLPSNSHGMRGVVRRGLSEGHLHLNSIHATEVAWADHLLKPLRHKPRGFETVEWRLLRLGRAASQVLALATAHCRAHREPSAAQVRVLLSMLDGMYFAQGNDSMEHYEMGLQKTLAAIIEGKPHPDYEDEPHPDYEDEPRPSYLDLVKADQWPLRRRRMSEPRGIRFGDEPSGKLGLLHWFGSWGQSHLSAVGQTAYSYGKLRHSIEREECLASLHLAAHLELVRARFQAYGVRGTTAGTASYREEGVPYATGAGRFLHRAMFRYLVCQTHHWQLAVQQGRTTGLRRFKQFYNSNQRWPIEPTSRQKADAVLRRAREWRGLRVLEGRVAPPNRSAAELMPWLTAFASGTTTRSDRIEKMGLVVHFIKEPEPRRGTGAGGSRRARYAELRSNYRRQALRLFRILERPTEVTPFIVGIDAANLELATPPEVFAPVFRYLRDQPIALQGPETVPLPARLLGGTIRELVGGRRLGMTYHVGEEFRHLLSGLRAIDEVLEFLAPMPGDRLGHGIALGLDPEVWLEQAGRQTVVPKQEWLDTLVWLYHFLGPGDDALGQLDVETNIERLGRELYLFANRAVQNLERDSIVSPLSLYNVWMLRQLDPEFLELSDSNDPIKFRPIAGDDSATWRWNRITKRVVEEVKKRVGSNPAYDLLARYWYSDKTRGAGEELELIDMEEQAPLWLEVCRKAQARLQDKVAREQVAIEVNPSANRVIGPMNRYSEHHVFNLTLDDKNDWKRRLRVTVNTDNPGTANTSLTHEFYLLGEALMSRKVPEAEVIEWLEWLRKNGEEGSFIRQLPRPTDRRMRRLVRSLRQQPIPFREITDPNVCLAELWRRWPQSQTAS